MWSITEVTNFDEVPYPDAHTLLYENPYARKPMVEVDLKPNSTWRDLWLAAEKALKVSGDAKTDHIYIEFLEYDEDGFVNLITGS